MAVTFLSVVKLLVALLHSNRTTTGMDRYERHEVALLWHLPGATPSIGIDFEVDLRGYRS
jgi:hypothetical protein